MSMRRDQEKAKQRTSNWNARQRAMRLARDADRINFVLANQQMTAGEIARKYRCTTQAIAQDVIHWRNQGVPCELATKDATNMAQQESEIYVKAMGKRIPEFFPPHLSAAEPYRELSRGLLCTQQENLN